MASLIPDFEYDIFISYRQKDNKHDGWVTEFVDNLKGELESTFKEEISVYFDINPHDGLLETHIVDASLREKLKCLVFIPVISRTYCDTKCFAWQHELCAFNKIAKEDIYGRDIRVTAGNVTSRILPVKIHDLDPEDKEILENELGGLLRGIEFIYREAGVNRPLKPNDDPKENLNRTSYRNQINKVANAVKEILTAIKKTDHQGTEVPKESARIKPTTRNKPKLKIIGSSLLVLALTLLGYFFIPGLVKSTTEVEKSIAVLPFINDSPDQENTYFVNGIMDEVLINLQKIKDFRVLSRTSIEQYRGDNKPPIPIIGKELDVNYIVEGSVQKYGNKSRIRVQLIAVKNERHLWGYSYEQEIKDPNDIFNIESQIAESIASELKATITPEEKQLIEAIYTTNLTAYDFYQRGEEELNKYSSDKNNIQALDRAREMYNKALEYDSAFSKAYLGLAEIYFRRHFNQSESYLSESYMDSLLILSDLALSFNDHLSDGYFFRGQYYLNIGNTAQTIKEWERALKYNPNEWQIYSDLGYVIYIIDHNHADYVKGLQNLYKALSLNHGKERTWFLRQILGDTYGIFAGFPEKQKYYYDEAFKLDNDSSKLIPFKSDVEKMESLKKDFLADSNNFNVAFKLSVKYFELGQYEESLKYIKKIENRLDGKESAFYFYRKQIGYIYLKNGFKKEAEMWFNDQKNFSEESLKKGRFYSVDAYLDLAQTYALLGDKGKALENLRMLNKIRVCPYWMLNAIKKLPYFNSISDDPEVRKILSDLEAKYQTEHERVRNWLEKQDNL